MRICRVESGGKILAYLQHQGLLDRCLKITYSRRKNVKIEWKGINTCEVSCDDLSGGRQVDEYTCYPELLYTEPEHL